MQISKKGEVGDIIMLFFVTVFVIIVLLIFIFTSSLFRAYSEIKGGSESVRLVEINEYMGAFKASFEGGKVYSEAIKRCSGIGEVWSKYLGKCICDANNGWTNKDKPELSYEPPCVNMRSGILLNLIDDSLDLKKHDASDHGYCVGFYSKKYFYYLLTSEDPSDLILELIDYDRNNNYVNRVNDEFMKGFKEEHQESTYKTTTRGACSKMNRDYRNYLVFYDNYVDNLIEGNADDAGYCMSFGDEGNVMPFMRTTREGCKMNDDSDNSNEYSFFVAEKGRLPVSSSELFRDVYISERFFPNYRPEDEDGNVVEGDMIVTDEVEEKCPDFFRYNLVFITGIYDEIKGKSGEELDLVYKRRGYSACSGVWQFLKRNEDEPVLKEAYRFEYEVLDREKGDICCYGKR